MTQLVDKNPGRGETRYWAFLAYDKVPVVAKLKVIDIKWDYENEQDFYECEILDVIQAPEGHYFKDGATTIIDYAWQLQPTLKQAILLLFTGIFSRDKDFFFRQNPPF